MKVVSFHCGTCGREVSVTDDELRNLRTVDCRTCTEVRAEGREHAGDCSRREAEARTSEGYRRQ